MRQWVRDGVALMGREWRAEQKTIAVLMVLLAAVDTLKVYESARIGDVSPYVRLFSNVGLITTTVAAVLANRVFGRERRQETWPFLVALPAALWTTLLAKLGFVVLTSLGLVWWRLGFHSLLGSPEPWLPLLVRVCLRVSAIAVLSSMVLSVVNIGGPRAMLWCIAAYCWLYELPELSAVTTASFGPQALLGVDAAIDDRTWPWRSLGVTMGLSAAIAVFVVLFFGRLPQWLMSTERRMGHRSAVVVAFLIGVGLVIDFAPIDLEPPRMTAEPLISGRATLLRGPSPADANADVAAPEHDQSLQPQKNQRRFAAVDGHSDAALVVTEATIAIVADALAADGVSHRPSAVLVYRDDLETPIVRWNGDELMLVSIQSNSALINVGHAVASALLWRAFDAETSGENGLAMNGLPGVIASRAVARVDGRAAAMQLAPAQVARASRLRCEDAAAWRSLGHLPGAIAAAAALVGGVVGDDDARLAEAIRRTIGGDDSFASIVGGCVDPVAERGTPWLVIRPPADLRVSVRALSDLTRGVVVHSSEPHVVKATVSVRGRDFGAPAITSQVDAAELEDGVLASAVYAPGSVVDVELFLVTDDGSGPVSVYGKLLRQRLR
jgi:hypothetical protein